MAATAIEPPGLPPADRPTETDPPEQALIWAADTFGERAALATSLGPQSLILIDMLHRAGRALPVFFLETGMHFEETLALRLRVQDRYGIAVEAVRPADPAAPEPHPSDPERCCALRKVEPLRRRLADCALWISGIRRAQGGARSSAPHLAWDHDHGLWKLNPLVAWSRAQVDGYLAEHRVPVNPLLSHGYTSVGCAPCTRPNADSTDQRAGRWAGSSKTECGIHPRLTILETSR